MKRKIIRIAIGFLLLLVIINLINLKVFESNDSFILTMLNDSNHFQKYEVKNYIKDFSNIFFNISIDKPVTLLGSSFNMKYVDTENYDYEKLSYITSYIQNNNNDSKEPLIYIYNSHQLENYAANSYEPYNIAFNVLTASYILQENLKKNEIESIVEKRNITNYIKENNLDYTDSYKASRYFIDDTLKKYASIKYIIDLHRDSMNKEYTTCIFGDKEYAKIMFVIGEENKNYEKNLLIASKINNLLIKNVPTLSRGIIKKKGAGVNGIYNQDMLDNAILIELGGYQNNIIEINNTIELLSSVLKELINEEK